MTDKAMQDLIKRLERLEKAVFDRGVSAPAKRAKSKHTGATGGIRFLAEKGYFDDQRTLGNVREELSEHGYRYSVHAVQMALNRLSKSSGPLVTFKEGGKKQYAKRK